MRALCCSADGVLGQKQQLRGHTGSEKRRSKKEGTFDVKQLKDQAVNTSQNCYRLATYSVVLRLHLVNRLRTSSRKICVHPSVFEGLRISKNVSSDIWPAHKWRFFDERTSRPLRVTANFDRCGLFSHSRWTGPEGTL